MALLLAPCWRCAVWPLPFAALGRAVMWGAEDTSSSHGRRSRWQRRAIAQHRWLRTTSSSATLPLLCLLVATTTAGSCAAQPTAALLRPCDIYQAAGTPCVAAHSVTRALYESYHGPLYQLKRSDGEVRPISPTPAGYADAAAQEAFCTLSGQYSCAVQTIYDQSPMQNHLTPSPASPAHYGKPGIPPRWQPGTPVDAMKHPIVLNGTRVYGAWFEQGDGYRNDRTRGIATGNEPESTIFAPL
jgi:hypothetical protein